MIRVNVHVHPGASVRRVGGSYDGALAVHVGAKAVGGAATSETIHLLAEAFIVRPSAVACVRGARSRNKLVAIDGDEAALTKRLHALLRAQ